MWNKLGWCSTLCLITYITTIFINYQASTGLITKAGVGEVSDKYELPITPAGWTFSIWAFIYIWQACWIVYLIVMSCKYSDKFNGTLLFGFPFYIVFILSNIFNSSWIIVWCNEEIIGAMILLLLITLALYLCVWISHRYLILIVPFYSDLQHGNYKCMSDKINENKKNFFGFLLDNESILKLLYIFVLNGIPFYATWCTIASCLNVGIAISYIGDIDTNASSLIMLSVLTVIILVYWSLDFWFLKGYLKYTFSPYITLLYAFLGGITNDYDFETPKIFVIILLIMSIIGTICKVISSLFIFKTPKAASHVTIQDV